MTTLHAWLDVWKRFAFVEPADFCAAVKAAGHDDEFFAQRMFERDPARWLCRAPDAQAAAVWALVMRDLPK